MINMLCKKAVVFVIILLFFGNTMLSVVDSKAIKNISRSTLKNKSFYDFPEMIKIRIRRHYVNGTFDETVKEVSIETVKEMLEKLMNTSSHDEILSVMKEYKLIPMNVNVEQFKDEVYQEAKKRGINRNQCYEGDLVRIDGDGNNQIAFNLLCEVFLWYHGMFTFLFRLGTSPFIGPLNVLILYFLSDYLHFFIPSVDIADIMLGISLLPSVMMSYGVFGEQDVYGVGVFALFGFAGLSFSFVPPLGGIISLGGILYLFLTSFFSWAPPIRDFFALLWVLSLIGSFYFGYSVAALGVNFLV